MPRSVFQNERIKNGHEFSGQTHSGPFCPLTEHTCRFGRRRCPYQHLGTFTSKLFTTCWQSKGSGIPEGRLWCGVLGNLRRCEFSTSSRKLKKKQLGTLS